MADRPAGVDKQTDRRSLNEAATGLSVSELFGVIQNAVAAEQPSDVDIGCGGAGNHIETPPLLPYIPANPKNLQNAFASGRAGGRSSMLGPLIKSQRVRIQASTFSWAGSIV